MRAVLANEDYKLHFFVPETGEHIERTINAKDFFKLGIDDFVIEGYQHHEKIPYKVSV